MNRILTQYLAREIFKSSAATVLVLYIILVSNSLGRVLADVADGDVPQQALWPVVLSQSIGILSIVLPIGLFLGIIFALGRLYADHEIAVMNACGVGYRNFYKPVAYVLLPLALFCLYSSVWLNAEVQNHAQSIVDREKTKDEFKQIKAGKFNQSKDGQRVIFMDSISDDRLEMREVIIGESHSENTVYESARFGRQSKDPISGDLFLVVGPGQRYEGKAGEGDFRIIEYAEHGMLLKNDKEPVASRITSEQKTPWQLWSSNSIDDQVELRWRIAMPLILLTLGFLAVPLAHISPRQGRFGKVGYAILVYIAYLNLIVFARAQLESQSLPMGLGFWWVHLLFLGFGGLLLYRRNRGIIGRRARC